jgi:hypothetical protein
MSLFPEHFAFVFSHPSLQQIHNLDLPSTCWEPKTNGTIRQEYLRKSDFLLSLCPREEIIR